LEVSALTAMLRSPITFWAQNKEFIFLRVDLQHVKDISVVVKDEGRTVQYNSTAMGANGLERQPYGFELSLNGSVEVSPNVKLTDVKVEITLNKANSGFWQHLTSDGKRLPWLKFDFERWTDSESEKEPADEISDTDKRSDYEKYNARLTEQFLKDYKGKTYTPEEITNKINLMYSSYLACYNLGMFLAHFYVLLSLLYGYVTVGREYTERFWDAHRAQLIVCTALQYFDVFHAFMGIIKSDVKTSLIQVTGRLAILYIIDGNPQIHTAVSSFALAVTYFSIEMFRYPFYTLSSLKLELWPISWLRYNMWIPLYPTGLFLELITMIRSVPYYYTTGKYGFSLPNAVNCSFNFGVFLAVFVVTAFPLIAYKLLLHMHRQRKKKMIDSQKKQS
jgi:very-long-chain (3R)-3-hydroxyacyl-CoA dehydratase